MTFGLNLIMQSVFAKYRLKLTFSCFNFNFCTRFCKLVIDCLSNSYRSGLRPVYKTFSFYS